MNYKTILIVLFSTLSVQSCKTDELISYKFNTKYHAQIKERLGHPFGTIVNLEVEIIDGNHIPLKAAQEMYLLKVNSVNNAKLDTSIIMFFEDESGKLTTDLIKSSLLNKSVNLIGYETGKFRGFPNGYAKYKMMKSGFVYGFQNYLIILSKP